MHRQLWPVPSRHFCAPDRICCHLAFFKSTKAFPKKKKFHQNRTTGSVRTDEQTDERTNERTAGVILYARPSVIIITSYNNTTGRAKNETFECYYDVEIEKCRMTTAPNY